jgi:protein-S-isoprenylcysteine O-methyltransferase Ste14
VSQIPAPRWAQTLNRLTTYLSQDFLGGPRPLALSTVINFQKGGTVVFVAGLMWWFGNWRVPAFVYLALHGTYGLCWLLKHAAFRDPRWDVRVTIGGAAMAFAAVLGPYWVAPVLLISPILGDRPDPGAAVLAASVAMHTFGLALMMSADAQKHFTRRYHPGLITDGLFARTRNPNYLGEMMVYGSYALLVRHWLPWTILGFVWGVLFLPNMLMKDQSLSRYPEWPAYRARTGLLLPR